MTEALIGSWKLLSFVDVPERGQPEYPHGKCPKGMITYTREGYVSVHIMSDPPPAASSAQMPGEKWKELLEGYVAYFGTYAVDPAGLTVIHNIEGSNWPAYIGTTQTRNFKCSLDILVLSGSYTRDATRYSYERIFQKIMKVPA